jgi:hypothetical protein
MTDLEFTVACWLIQAVAYTPIWLPGLLAGWGMYAVGRRMWRRARDRAADRAASDRAWVELLAQEAVWEMPAYEPIGEEDPRP